MCMLIAENRSSSSFAFISHRLRFRNGCHRRESHRGGMPTPPHRIASHRITSLMHGSTSYRIASPSAFRKFIASHRIASGFIGMNRHFDRILLTPCVISPVECSHLRQIAGEEAGNKCPLERSYHSIASRKRIETHRQYLCTCTHPSGRIVRPFIEMHRIVRHRERIAAHRIASYRHRTRCGRHRIASENIGNVSHRIASVRAGPETIGIPGEL